MTLSTRDEILLYNRKPAHYGITFMAESGVNVSLIGLYENRTFAGFTHFFRYITQYWTAEVSSNILLLVPVKFSLSTRRNSVNVELTFVSSNAAAEAFSKQFFFHKFRKVHTSFYWEMIIFYSSFRGFWFYNERSLVQVYEAQAWDSQNFIQFYFIFARFQSGKYVPYFYLEYFVDMKGASFFLPDRSNSAFCF